VVLLPPRPLGRRLDAIGAIGIARCFTFGGRFSRVLYDPEVAPREGLTKEQYMQGSHQATTINHFHEKLFKLAVRAGLARWRSCFWGRGLVCLGTAMPQCEGFLWVPPAWQAADPDAPPNPPVRRD